MAKLIGLDIGSTTMKLVELEQSGRMQKLITVGVSATPPKGLLSEASFDQIALSEAVKKLALDAKVGTKSVNVALPENMVYTRVIQMPQLSEAELASAIRWEAEQYIPLPLSEVVLDYKVMQKGTTPNEGARMQVFLVAAPKTVVGKYQKVIELAGLELVSIETESLALGRALLEESQSSPVTLVVSIGAQRTTVFMAKGSAILLTYVIPSGGNALTRAIATDLEIDQMQAEEYKKTYGLKKDVLSGKIVHTLTPLLANLISELKRTISFYQEKSEQPLSMKRIVLVGGGAKLPGLVVYLTENLGIETQIGDPWQKVSGTAKLSSQPFDPILFSEAVGLALKP